MLVHSSTKLIKTCLFYWNWCYNQMNATHTCYSMFAQLKVWEWEERWDGDRGDGRTHFSAGDQWEVQPRKLPILPWARSWSGDPVESPGFTCQRSVLFLALGEMLSLLVKEGVLDMIWILIHLLLPFNTVLLSWWNCWRAHVVIIMVMYSRAKN